MSTAKSMAANYLSAKRNSQLSTTNNIPTPTSQRFKSSNSNLAIQSNGSLATRAKSSVKSTSMTNLSRSSHSLNSPGTTSSTMHRPASRNALDSIHCGMNAKYAQVQSKVLLQNIRPQSRASNNGTPATGASSSSRTSAATGATRATRVRQQNAATADKQALAAKLKSVQEELERVGGENESLRSELERERSDKLEQLQQLKSELQEKANEHERHNEDYHQKLLEAYELADQNRRAAETVLHESRARDEENRSKIEDLESQLNELREFVSMKEEMSGKMMELREQLREERDRYEAQLRNLHQVFENEKLSKHYVRRSNYFNRTKPNLMDQSSECIDSTGKMHNISDDERGAKMHRSEHDLIYGSKLSTRMQVGARSAWKASKQFASSVITGGVSLNACRSKRRRSGSTNVSITDQSTQLGATHARHQVNQQVIHQQQCAPATLEQQQQQQQVVDVNDELTSVIQVKSASSAQKLPAPAACTNEHEDIANNNNNNNGKLTIVTDRYNSDVSDAGIGSNASSSSAQLTPPTVSSSSPASSDVDNSNKSSINKCDLGSGCGSPGERNRCESSSSGRGTASDADSTGADSSSTSNEKQLKSAQEVDALADNNTVTTTTTMPPPIKQRSKQATTDMSTNEDAGNCNSNNKRHKRKSSLFKASKMFGGSQASLNVLRALFTSATGNHNQTQPSRQQTATFKTTSHTSQQYNLATSTPAMLPHTQPNSINLLKAGGSEQLQPIATPDEAISAAEREIRRANEAAALAAAAAANSSRQQQQQVDAAEQQVDKADDKVVAGTPVQQVAR